MRSGLCRALCGFFLGLLVCEPALATVRISEFMYHPALEDDLEYIELTNTGPTAVDLTGWAFTNGVSFEFPAQTVIAPAAFVIVCQSEEAFLDAYPSLPENTLVLGNYEGRLANDGERLTLSSPEDPRHETLRYDDVPPWEFLADGFGASLERLCFDSDPELPESWRASPLQEDPQIQPGGTPGAAIANPQCPAEFAPRPGVFLSEIMYHAVLEESVEEEYEFVEIHNASGSAVDLEGWRLAGGIDYTFPPGVVIGAAGYLVIAKSPERLREVESYNLDASELLGPYQRTLDNGGEKVALLGHDNQGIDSVNYDDDEPWPVAADALGAGRSWLPEELLPLAEHRFLGHSLERVSFEIPAGEVANWAPSPLDGPTPGRANASAREAPLPIVTDIDVEAAETGERLIGAEEEVLILIEFSPQTPAEVELDYFIEDLEALDEEIHTVSLTEGDDGLFAILPGRPDNTIVRYRIRADRGEGDEVVSPRPTDPFEWHSYFVSPVIETTTRIYQLFISRRSWGQLNTNIARNRVVGCNENPLWNAREPAIFVHDGNVFDAQVRFQGSRWNRGSGATISGWPVAGPSPGSAAVRSWRIALPRYSQLEGRDALVLNKLTQGCPGHNAGVGYRLFAEADLPSPETRFVRLFINGAYYRYMMEYERPGEEMLRRYHREMAEKYPERPREKVGHFFKSVGCTCDEGPFGWGDWRLINSFCGHTDEVRYAHTYDRKTHQWADSLAIKELIEGMHQARGSMRPEDIPAMREWVLEHFDLELLLNYIAIINWQVPFDDMFQNHFAYQRLSDGKWIITPWDLDQNFGEYRGGDGRGPLASWLIGRRGDRSNRSGWWHRLKDTVLFAFQEEYEQHLLVLNNTLLHPDHVSELVDLVTSQASQEEANAAASRLTCGSFATRDASFKRFALERHAYINEQLIGVVVDAGADQTVFAGAQVVLDGTASEPPPGPEVTYTWSNGLEGATPVAVFEAPGVYELTLAITKQGIEFTDRVRITVLAVPEEVFLEQGGAVVIEAESFHENEDHDAEDVLWEERTEMPGFSGTGYMHAVEVNRKTFTLQYLDIAPELRYTILFRTPGTYRVWLRGFVDSRRSDSVHISLDRQVRSSREATEFGIDEENFQWSGIDHNDKPQAVAVQTPGLRLLSAWVRQSNFIFDKIILTLDPEFVPQGAGPSENPKGPPTGSGQQPFVRGDANNDDKVNVTDGVAILTHLLRGSGLVACEDHGDVDDNGKLEIADVVRLLSFFFRHAMAPPPPFPQLGFDPTADDFPCGDG